MGYMSNKALIIAVSLLVTMTIASAVLLIINQVTGVYRTVYETDTLIQSNFDEFDAYDGAVKNQLDLLNVAKKYKDATNVFVTLNSQDNVKNGEVGQQINTSTGIETLKNNIDEKINENGTVVVDSSKAAEKYNTYVYKSDDMVYIGFVKQI